MMFTQTRVPYLRLQTTAQQHCLPTYLAIYLTRSTKPTIYLSYTTTCRALHQNDILNTELYSFDILAFSALTPQPPSPNPPAPPPPRWFTLLTVLRRWSRCRSYSLLLCGLFYEAICFMSYLVSFVLVFFSPFSIAITWGRES